LRDSQNSKPEVKTPVNQEQQKAEKELSEASKVTMTEDDTKFLSGGGDFDELLKSTFSDTDKNSDLELKPRTADEKQRLEERARTATTSKVNTDVTVSKPDERTV
jgi:hypothetical protein